MSQQKEAQSTLKAFKSATYPLWFVTSKGFLEKMVPEPSPERWQAIHQRRKQDKGRRNKKEKEVDRAWHDQESSSSVRLTHTEGTQGLYGRKGKSCKASVLLREGASGLVSTTVFYEGLCCAIFRMFSIPGPWALNTSKSWQWNQPWLRMLGRWMILSKIGQVSWEDAAVPFCLN